MEYFTRLFIRLPQLRKDGDTETHVAAEPCLDYVAPQDWLVMCVCRTPFRADFTHTSGLKVPVLPPMRNVFTAFET